MSYKVNFFLKSCTLLLIRFQDNYNLFFHKLHMHAYEKKYVLN